MKTVIEANSLKKNLDQVFHLADQDEEILIKKNQAIYHLRKHYRLNDKRKVKDYVEGYRKFPESSRDNQALAQLATSVLSVEEW